MNTNIKQDQGLAFNPVIGLSVEDVQKASREAIRQSLMQPAIMLEQTAKLWRDFYYIAMNQSKLAPSSRDRRFADESFRQNPLYASLLKTWLAWEQRMLEWVDALDMTEIERERTRFIVQLYVDSLAPTNFLLGNPSALRKAYESGGSSLLNGFKQFVEDVQENGGMPSQVDKRAFTVGGNLATTEGSVVFRIPVLELIQYQPVTKMVKSRPVFIVPPQINKYYLYDLSEHNSFVRYLLNEGFQVFIVSWRNPTAEHRDWGIASYVEALDQAIDVCLEISGQDAVNTVGACAGGITLSAALGYFQGKGTLKRVKSMTLMVNVLESEEDDSVLGLFASKGTIESARSQSDLMGVMDGRETSKVFNWMRPNDLIWNYHVSNYLHGEKPPVFDVLYWNNDTTRLPAKLHSDFLDIFSINPFSKPGSLTINGVPIDLSSVDCDVLITGGTTDHITPWQACYRSTRLFGGKVTYLLST
ncbi:MAG: alpha/beta fold hydrolase, partial [Gammaproteobacteria bacterium]|nr:alpha/beta fold hydrolase [Gammaproteobacteria bacterium]